MGLRRHIINTLAYVDDWRKFLIPIMAQFLFKSNYADWDRIPEGDLNILKFTDKKT